MRSLMLAAFLVGGCGSNCAEVALGTFRCTFTADDVSGDCATAAFAKQLTWFFTLVEGGDRSCGTRHRSQGPTLQSGAYVSYESDITAASSTRLEGEAAYRVGTHPSGSPECNLSGPVVCEQ